MDADSFNAIQLGNGKLTMSNVTQLVTVWQERHPPLDDDGKAGTATIKSLNAAVAPTHPEDKDWGLHSLDVAISILGWGETIANNKGPQITIIRGGRKLKRWQKGAWCADTTSFEVLDGYAHFYGFEDWKSTPLERQKLCPMERTPSASKFARNVIRAGGKKVLDPRPGDFVLFKYPGNHHIAIFADSKGNRFRTIDGNRGRWNKVTKTGSVVDYYNHEFGEPSIKGFYRLPDLVA